MTQEEIRARFAARKVENQMEFDRLMAEINDEQARCNHPYLDREMELLKKRELLMQQKSAINIQLNAINVERVDLEQKRKDINRVFHDVKHELIMLNPREQYAKNDVTPTHFIRRAA